MVMLLCLSRTFVTQAMKPPHIAVVGGGLAGLSATIEAQRHGAIVTLIEKETKLGGNSAKATRYAIQDAFPSTCI
jgi:heterodisulfide reductase subunit A-like polyferredoxin